VAAVLILTSCTVPPESPAPAPTPVSTPVDRLSQVRRTVDGLARSALATDRSGFFALVSDRDPTFASRARLVFDNLSTLPLAELFFEPVPAERPVPPNRAVLLGPDAFVQPVLVRWRLKADDEPALHRVWLTFVPGSDGVRLAGTFDGPTTDPLVQQPSWWLGPLTAAQQGGVTVLAGAGQSTGRWLAVVRAAASAVRRRLPADRTDWAGEVVVEVPASPADFAAVLGQPLDRYAAIAAVAHEVGEGDRPPLRVVINPRARSQVTDDQLTEIVRHEIVHVATRSPQSPAPLWAVEGLAEWVALRDRPGSASFGTAELLAAVRRDGPPRALPSDQAFGAGQDRLNRAYAEAWLACRYIADTYSARGLGRLYAELDRGRSLDEASRAVLGVDAAGLTTGWRRYLVRQAGAR
jgi:hypothetical protein